MSEYGMNDPDPKSGLFDLDVVAAEVAKEPFRFRYHGREWSLPHMSDIDWRIIEAADGGDIAAVRKAFRLGFGDQYAEWEKKPQPLSAMSELFRRWQSHAGTKPGESEASPDSSESTAGPSNRASRRATRASGSANSSPVS